MNRLSNWYFLTGSVSQLQRVWNSYGVLVSTVGAGAMIAHSDLAFVIDGHGRERDALDRRSGADADVRVLLHLPPPQPDRPSPQFVRSRVRRGAGPTPAPRAAGGSDCLGRVRPRRRPGAGRARRPMVSAVSTSTDSWVTLPMGDLSDPSNTFWELFHTVPGASHWSLVTPPGVADNGGLIESASAGTAVVGVLPSQLLRFSPLAQSADGGTSWVPAFLPGALASAARRARLRIGLPGWRHRAGERGPSAERTDRPLVVVPLVTAAALSRASPECGVVGLDGATLLPGGAPLIATGCRARRADRPVHADR